MEVDSLLGKQLAGRVAKPKSSALEWLLMQPQAPQPRSKAIIDAELAAERDW